MVRKVSLSEIPLGSVFWLMGAKWIVVRSGCFKCFTGFYVSLYEPKKISLDSVMGYLPVYFVEASTPVFLDGSI